MLTVSRNFALFALVVLTTGLGLISAHADDCTSKPAVPAASSPPAPASSGPSDSDQKIDKRIITGCLGLKWGDSEEIIRKVLSDKGYVEVQLKHTPNAMCFAGQDMEFAGEDVTAIFAFVAKKGFAKALICLKKPMESDMFKMYDRVVDKMTAKYGDPDDTTRDFDYPYKDGDGDEDQAVESGKTDIGSIWNVHLVDGDDAQSGVIVHLGHTTKTSIIYKNSRLMDLYLAEKQADAKDL